MGAAWHIINYYRQSRSIGTHVNTEKDKLMLMVTTNISYVCYISYDVY